MTKKEKILHLRSLGQVYNEIAKNVPCSKALVSYYLGNNQKQKCVERSRKYRSKSHPYLLHYNHFVGSDKRRTYPKNQVFTSSNKKRIYEKFRRFSKGYDMKNFTLEDVISKLGNNPKCYLTGDIIDINKPKSFQFDHIVPKSRGGDNSLENLGICTRDANLMKSDKTPDELINMCKKVLENFGYSITK